MFNFSKTLSSPLKILCAAVVLITISGLMTAAAAAESAKATVNGMVCAFCAQGIEKRLSSLPATKAVFVDLRKKIVAVEARVRPLTDPMKMNGCALVLLNGPDMASAFQAIAGWVAQSLGEGGESRVYPLSSS